MVEAVKIEKHEVDGIEFTYSRSRRKKTASLFIERDGSIYLIAPDNLAVDRIENIVKDRKTWIYKSIAEWKDLNSSQVKREFISGESFLYLGRNYKLKICGDNANGLTLLDDCFCISRESLKDSEEMFKLFYKEEGLERLPKRVEYYKTKLRVEVNNIRIMELKNRWASCTMDGNLNFHWKCMMAPLSVIDYIVAHELTHLIHKDHSDKFWAELDKIMPDFLERKNWLKKNGAGLSL